MSFRNASTIAAASLLVIATVASLATVLSRTARDADPDIVTIRLSHTFLDAGLREALDGIARDYERLQLERGKRVRIALIDIPDRVYPQWVRTQLIGGTAPEIVYTESIQGFDDRLTVRYLVPTEALIREPNPYNADTPLEGVPWRSTFHDNLERAGMNLRLSEPYGIPLSATTIRLCINGAIVDAIRSDPAHADLAARLDAQGRPTDFASWMDLCTAIRARTFPQGSVVPIAGSDYNSRLLLDNLFGSQTQQLIFDWDPDLDNRPSYREILLLLAQGRIHYDNPAFRQAFELLREVASHIQPGFMQMRREDASFLFAQQRAAMIAISSWDAPTLRALVGGRFDIRVFPIPLPSRDHPRYGDYALGPISEADVIPRGTFSFVNYHPEERQRLAIDFIHYLTSLPVNERFSRKSGWLPSVVGARPDSTLEPFMHAAVGFPAGPFAHLNTTEMRGIVDTSYHLLFGPGGDTDTFLDSVAPRVEAIAAEALSRDLRRARQNFEQVDSVQGALLWRHLRGDTDVASKLAGSIDNTEGAEVMYYYYLNETPAPPR